MADGLTPDQRRRIDEIREHLAVVQHIKRLVTDLESNRAARPNIIQGICESIARELSELRQRTLTARLGSVPDIAGAMSVMASRGAGLSTKLRGLGEGVVSLTMELDQALRNASTPAERGREPEGTGGAPKRA